MKVYAATQVMSCVNFKFQKRFGSIYRKDNFKYSQLKLESLWQGPGTIIRVACDNALVLDNLPYLGSHLVFNVEFYNHVHRLYLVLQWFLSLLTWILNTQHLQLTLLGKNKVKQNSRVRQPLQKVS